MTRFGLLCLDLLNFLVLQWFFVRLAYCDDHDDIEWGIALGLVPLTGWTFLGGGLRGLKDNKDCHYLLAINPWIVDAALFLVVLVGMMAFVFILTYLALNALGVLL